MKKQRKSRQRQLILDTVMTRCDHPTADQIYLDVRAKHDKISRGTVYRNLGLLSEDGEVTNVKVPAASADRYDSRQDLHYHLYCINCGGVFDAPLSYRPEFDKKVEEETGFQVIRHRSIFEGICPKCAKQMENQEKEVW